MSACLKKLVTFTFIISIAFKSFAPGSKSFVIVGTQPVEPYRRLIHAIGMVETKFDTLAFNPVEKAAGYFQIRPIRLEDYNQRTGSHYLLTDLFDYRVSEKIFLYYASEIGPYDLERIARNWNGSGKGTFLYWKGVKTFL